MQASTPNGLGSGPAGGAGRRRIGGLLLVLAMLAGNGAPSFARAAEKDPAAKQLIARPAMTAESAAGVARRETGGRVLSVTPLEGGQQGWRVRLLLDGGRVTTVLVDPRGGVRRQLQ